MARLLFAVLLLCVGGCSPHVRSEQTVIMDMIERQISLPKGARPLKTYARAYAPSSNERVSALYFRPDASLSSCAGAKAGGPTNGQIALLCPPPDGFKAGERRWLTNSRLLPSVSDGGCAFIDVEFDIPSTKIISAQCHGSG